MIKNELINILKDFEEWRGNAGCNDAAWDYTPETWDFLNEIADYGVANGLWDNDPCHRPSRYDSKILWWDTSISSYLIHALQNGNLCIH